MLMNYNEIIIGDILENRFKIIQYVPLYFKKQLT